MNAFSARDIKPGEPTISRPMIFLLAASCGLIVANLYYAQPLAGLISSELQLSPAATGLIVTLTQLGYGLGLLLIVPLGDLVENKRLVVISISTAVLALLAAAFSPSAAPFLIAALLIGISSVAVQIIVPYAAHMAPDAVRGRVVGNVMSGLMMGIMLARPVAGLVAEFASWRMVFIGSAIIMAVLSIALARILPKRVPVAKLGYGALLASMGRLAITTPVLQRRAIYHALMFATFSLFWTTIPLYLSGPAFGLSQGEIALFALAGAAGAVAAPIAGRMADRGWTKPATGFAMLIVAASYLITHIAAEGSHTALFLLVMAAIILDFGVTTNLVLGQRAIFALGAEARSRLNGVYMATFFLGGAAGSAVGGWAYASGQWTLTSWIGFSLPVVALVYFATE